MQLFLLLIVMAIFPIGCTDTGQSYSKRMKQLADEFEANPNQKTVLRELENYTTDSDYWNRSYAYGYLGELAFKNVGGCQPELIPYFNKAIKDSDYGIKQAGVQAIYDIGSPAVEQSLPTLLDIVKQGNEDDVTWRSIEALGKLDDSKKSQEVLPILLNAASKPPPDGTPDEAPQVRYYALDSIIELTKKNNLNTIPDLGKLLNKSKLPYTGRVAKAILELDPKNEKAQQIFNTRTRKRVGS